MKSWRNLSVASKLYWVIGAMAFLIAAELVTVRFAMDTLSAVRAFVHGEGLWSKGQKNAAYHLQRFNTSHREADYQAFLKFLQVPEGDHQALVELGKPEPDMAALRAGFLQGGIHPDDIPPMVRLLRRFSRERHIARALAVWAEADALIFKFKEEGIRFHGLRSPTEIDSSSSRLMAMNDHLTELEAEFSEVLGQGSRWLEGLLITVLLGVVVTVESVGLTLTFLTTRSISRGLASINAAATRIGRGDFTHPLVIDNQDEIGDLSRSIDTMRELLSHTYQELETRVQDRTAELSRMVTQNAELLSRANDAVRMRDEFMSIAAHELKTPLTALYMQLQMMARHADSPKSKTLAEGTLVQARRLNRLAEELMDLTRLRVGKFELKAESCDLVAIVQEVASQLSPEAALAGSTISVEAEGPVQMVLDPVRITQVVTNLVSNAIKYGKGQPISVRVGRQDKQVLLEVQDHGIGIPEDHHLRIFDRFERVTNDEAIMGLGLGLYITRQIVAAHGGTITVKSRLGEGSVFTVGLRQSVAKASSEDQSEHLPRHLT